MTRICVAIVLFAAVSALAQPVGVGLKSGLPLDDAFTLIGSGFNAEKPAYTLGPFVELRLRANFAIEVDALYEGLKFNFEPPGLIGLPREISTTTASSWQFPLLLKYRFGRRLLRPYIEGGVAAYHIGNVKQVGQTITQLPSQVSTALSRVGSSFINGGGVIGGGVELKLGLLRIAPEIRFTRWAIDKSVGTQAVSLRLNNSQTHFLVGLSF